MTEILVADAPRPVNSPLRAGIPSPNLFAGAPIAAVSGTDRDPYDFANLEPSEALTALRTWVLRGEVLSVDLYERVLAKVVGAVHRSYRPDGLFLPAQSRLGSVHASAQRRDGDLYQAGVVAAVAEHPRLVLVPSERIAVARNVANHVARMRDGDRADIDLPPVGETTRTIMPDLVMIDLRDNAGWIIELKRGGRLGAEHQRWLRSNLLTSSLCVQAHLSARDYAIETGTAAVVVLNDETALRVPDDQIMKLHAFDACFGTRAVAIATEIRRVHAEAIALLLRPLQRAALAEADAVLRDRYGAMAY